MEEVSQTALIPRARKWSRIGLGLDCCVGDDLSPYSSRGWKWARIGLGLDCCVVMKEILDTTQHGADKLTAINNEP